MNWAAAASGSLDARAFWALALGQVLPEPFVHRDGLLG